MAKKNCIWVMCDQLRAQALSCNGDENVHTPHIDLLARTGINFNRAVGGSPLCCPCRGSMLTGRYPHHCVPGHERRLPTDQTTIAQVFAQNGYHTAYVGKWHLDGFHEEEGRAAFHVIPPERRGGFDYWMGYENNNSQYDCYVHGGDARAELPPTRLPGYETDSLTDLLLTHLDSLDGSQPFFAVLSVQPPHDPYVAPPQYLRSFSPATLKLRSNVPAIEPVQRRARGELSGAYAMIENLDDNVGRLVAYLKEKGLYDDTYILFFSDHGDMHGSHGMYRKTTPYEEALRVPFIVSGGAPICDEWHIQNVGYPLNHVDIAPTTLGLCGIAPPDCMEGTDCSSFALRREAPRNLPSSAFIQIVEPTGHPDSEEYPWRGIVTTDGYKYVTFAGMPWLMFNLNEDPYELVNLAHNTFYADKRRALQQELRSWLTRTGDNFPID